MIHWLRNLVFLFLARPLVHLVLGVHVLHYEKLLVNGPAIVVANHNSHLDTLVLMSLLPLRFLKRLRPVAAMDYFLRNRLVAWFALRVVGILPVDRNIKSRREHPLAACSAALENNEILILFPEGTRGDPEQLSTFKSGVAHLAKRHPEVPVIPVFLQGLGRALPKGECVLIPFFCDVVIGDPIAWTGSRSEFMDSLENTVKSLAAEVNRS